jgi:hypothetical protein
MMVKSMKGYAYNACDVVMKRMTAAPLRRLWASLRRGRRARFFA